MSNVFSRELMPKRNAGNAALNDPKRHGYVDDNGECRYCRKSSARHAQTTGVCPKCGKRSRFGGVIVWCECIGWIQDEPNV